LRYRHLEITNSAINNAYSDIGLNFQGIAIGYGSDVDPNVLIDSCYIHDQGGLHIKVVYGDYYRVSNNFFAVCCQANNTGHKEIMKFDHLNSHIRIHNNIFKDWRGYSVTGGIILGGGDISGDMDDWDIYDNIFYWTGETLSGGNRAVDGLDSSVTNHKNIRVTNNTFYNIGQSSAANVCGGSGVWTSAGNIVKNNLWISCDGLSAVSNETGVTKSNNAFYDTPNYTSREATDVSLNADPLTNSAGYDFTVASDVIKTGADLSAYYTTDFVGNLWSTWGMGAYVYAGEPAPDVTAPTISSATIGTSGTTITIVFLESITLNNNTGFTLTMSGVGAVGLSYASSTNATTIIYNITGRTIEGPPAKETGTLDYVTVTNGIEDLSGNDLASTGESDIVVDNDSAYTPTVASYDVTPTSGEGCYISPYTLVSVSSEGTTQFTCTPISSNYQCIAWTQTGAGCGTGSGTTTFTTGTITGACAINQPCLKKSADVTIGSGCAITVGSGAAVTIY
jgi:hypothetical protein